MAVVLPLVLIGVGALWGFASSAGQAVGWSLLGLHLAGAGTRIRGPAHAFWWTGLAGMGTVLLGAAVGADAVLSIHPEAWIAAGWVGMYAAAAAAMEDRNGTDSVIKGAWLPALAAGLGAAAVAVPLAGSPQGPRFLALSAFVIGAALMGGGGFRPTRPPRTGGGLLRWLPASAGESQAWWWSLLLPIEAGVAIASQAAPWNMLAGFVLLAVWPAAYLLARRAARRVDAA